MDIPKLFSPGPTPLSRDVLAALASPPRHHRSEAFSQVVSKVYDLLPLLFDEENQVVLSSTGTGGLEAALINFASYKDHVLSVNAGKFGERWGDLCKVYGLSHNSFTSPWGKKINLQNLKSHISTHEPSVFCMQACETSTGSSFDLKQIKKILPKNCLFIVDGITAVGAYPLSMKEAGIDVLIAGSQKALGLPVGLSIVAFSDRAKEKAKTSDLPRFYFDILKELKNIKNSTSTTWSTPTQLWQALLVELEKLNHNTGLSDKLKLNKEAQNLIFNWVKDTDFELFSECPSLSLTALLAPPNISTKKIQTKLIKEGYFIGAGQGSFKDKLIRIGHMANVDLDDLKKLLSLLKKTLEESESIRI